MCMFIVRYLLFVIVDNYHYYVISQATGAHSNYYSWYPTKFNN